MPKGGGGYGSTTVGESVATELKRKPVQRVSYLNTKRPLRTKSGNGHLGTLKPLPNPKG